ncbi:MFS transporter [Luteibacter aegosomatissinici]|uniref:MFS transporter n=1 Tax=Luteibacter aegosomatissinici TaxID=2911539 RepID=UPI001FF86D9D|nr:MFS transporter [Luteibacter aegosomatissinici]UPG94515.1 MFS transporter [Luteibacter aegosomatissinici]
MTSAAPALDPGTPPVRAPHVGLVILALAVGGFAIGTTEFASMSMLPLFAQGLGIDAPTAGHAISAYALGVVVGAPIITVLGARLPRRRLLLLLMAMFTVFNGLTGLSPNYHWMLVFRFLAGLPHGAYFGVAALVASSLVPPNRRTRAVGQMFLGLTVATIAGVPLASWLGQAVGWRWSFALVALLGIATMSAVFAFAPNTPADAKASPMRELSALKRSQVWITLGIGAIGFGGMFAVYTYLADILLSVTHMPLSTVPWIMGVFGIGMTLGNMVIPVFADRALMRTAGALLVWAIVILAIFPFTAGNVWTLGITVFFIGLGGALGTVLQTRLMDVAGDAQALAAALNHSAFNTANALGPFLGGLAIANGYGWTSPGWVGSGLALGGLLLWAVSVAVERNSEAQEAAQTC